MNRFEDDRGVIEDWHGPGGQVPFDVFTHITTVKGAVRGNHVHDRTWQWTVVLSGRLVVADGKGEATVGPGRVVVNEPGVPHAWKALEDSECLVFTKGPRSGKDFESDTRRLERPLL